MDTATGKVLVTLVEPSSDQTLAFTPDGRTLVVGTQGPAEVVDVASGRVVKRLSPPGQTLATGKTNPVAVAGDILVVGENVTGAADVSAQIDLWDTKTWTMFDALTPITGTAVGAVSMSPDGQQVADREFRRHRGRVVDHPRRGAGPIVRTDGGSQRHLLRPAAPMSSPPPTTGRPASTGPTGPGGRR